MRINFVSNELVLPLLLLENLCSGRHDLCKNVKKIVFGREYLKREPEQGGDTIAGPLLEPGSIAAQIKTLLTSPESALQYAVNEFLYTICDKDGNARSFIRSFASFVLFSLAAATVVSYFGLGQAAGLAAMKGLFKPKETTREDVEKILEEKKRARERKQNEDAKS
jgi:hypothetical protein